jgi:ribosomal protein L16 Arg81 hydroxylase
MQEASGFDLARLLRPVSTAAFFEDYYERRPLVVSRNCPNYFAPLLTVDAVERLFTVLPPDTVFVTDSDKPLQVTDFARQDKSGPSLDAVKACQLFAGGATIVVRDAHQRLETLVALARELECAFSAPFKANLYMTPPRGKGFDTHYDTHDVLVLQIVGSKQWTVFDSPLPLPLSGQRFDPQIHPAGPETMSVELRAGDLLYVPRGFLHHGRSGEDVSLHATLGLLSFRWADVLIEAVAQLCLSDPTFRHALPIDLGRPDFDKARAQQIFAGLMAQAAKNADAASVLDRLADEFVIGRRALIPGQLRQLAAAHSLSAADHVGVRPATRYRLATNGNAIVIRAHGREIGVPAEAVEAVKFALSNEQYFVRDIPGDLDDDDKVNLVRGLIAEGLVWKVSAP